MDPSKPALLIAATHRSCGKTMLTMGLIAAALKRGLTVQPFKKGPDYIDPMWLAAAAGRACFNLDPLLMTEQEVERTFTDYSRDVNLSLVEGNKGLFDGLALDGSNCNAQLAKSLGLPVLLVIDARGMTRGIAPLILGYQAFDRGVHIGGVILNKLGGSRHEAKLRAVIEHYTDVPVLGAVQASAALTVPERHLGLIAQSEMEDAASRIAAIGQVMSESLELAAILDLAAARRAPSRAAVMDMSSGAPQLGLGRTPASADRFAPEGGPGLVRGEQPGCATQLREGCALEAEKKAPNITPNISPYIAPYIAPEIPPSNLILPNTPLYCPPGARALRIGIARDKAFGFYYPDDLMALERAGAQLLPFDTLADRALPPGLDGLIIGGGFPEVFALAIEANAPMRAAIHAAITSGLPAYAECAGVMVLSRSLRYLGRAYCMAGVIEADAVMHERPVGRGYVQWREGPDMPWPHECAPDGKVVRAGHEFHYSSLENLSPEIPTAYRMERGFGLDGVRDGLRVHNLLASYVHQRHTGGNNWPQRFIGFVRALLTALPATEGASCASNASSASSQHGSSPGSGQSSGPGTSAASGAETLNGGGAQLRADEELTA